MQKIIKIIKILLLIISLSSLVVFAFPRETFKDFGEYAWNILIVVMFIRPLRDLFPNCRVFKFVSKIRRELGILVGIFALAHTIGAFMEYMEAINHTKTYLDLFFDKYVWDYTKFMFWGMIAFLISIPLLITSNGLSTSILGKHWKTLQRLSYFMFVFVAIHMFMIKKELGPLVVVGIWCVLYVTAFIKNKKNKIPNSTGKKWLCVPCGYIYDESIGDPDSGILPGTKFEDIPDNWRCPVCGVTKKDFVLFDENKNEETICGEIVGYSMLTSNVLELVVEFEKILISTPGQYISFLFSDRDGSFKRAYSIVNQKNNIFKFCIKLSEDGRGGAILKKLKVGDKINILGVFGDFVLKDTNNPKVFVATGTGLSPIINMLKSNGGFKKTIHFCVAKFEDLFYVDEIKNIQDLDYKIYLSKEELDGYIKGRIDLSKYEFDKNTEFYICGNPSMVQDIIDYLKSAGYTNIYFEKFV